MDYDKLLSTKEAAKFLKVAPQTMRGWRGKKHFQPLKFYRVGRNCRYDIKDLKAYLLSGQNKRLNKKLERAIGID